MTVRRFIKKYGRRKKRRVGNLLSIGTICIVLIAAFGFLGASYASWSQPFTIFGSINTGSISVIVKDVIFDDSSDNYSSLSLNKDIPDGTLEQVDMNILTSAYPYNAVLIFVVENNGTIPVECEGIDASIPDKIHVEIVDAPDIIAAGQTAHIKVRFKKGYCRDFEFSTFFRFVQATG